MSQFMTNLAKELYARRWAILTYCGISVVFMVMYLATYPSIQQQADQLAAVTKNLPKALLEAFNIDQMRMLTLDGYLADKHFGFTWPLMAILLLLSTAGRQLAGEIERGTLAVQLSLPISRTSLYLSKYLAGLAILVVFTTCSVGPTMLAPVFHSSMPGRSLQLLFTLSLALGWAIYSLGFMAAALVSERSKAYSLVGGLLLVMYVTGVISQLVDKLDKLKYLSLFHYYQPGLTVSQGYASTTSYLVYVGLAIICTLVGLWGFRRRDITI